MFLRIDTDPMLTYQKRSVEDAIYAFLSGRSYRFIVDLPRIKSFSRQRKNGIFVFEDVTKEEGFSFWSFIGTTKSSQLTQLPK